MHYLWGQLSGAVSLIVHHPHFLLVLLWATVRVVAVSTSAAVVLGIPIAVAIALGRFRGRRVVRALANASLGLPPVVVGVVVLLALIPNGPFGSLHWDFTLRGIYVVQAILAMPFVVAFGAAALEAVPPGLLAQARALGAGRRQVAALAVREARIGLLAAVIAGAGAVVSEVGGVLIVGGAILGHDEILSTALLANFTYTSNETQEVAVAITLALLLLVLVGVLTFIQQRDAGIRLRFRGA